MEELDTDTRIRAKVIAEKFNELEIDKFLLNTSADYFDIRYYLSKLFNEEEITGFFTLIPDEMLKRFLRSERSWIKSYVFDDQITGKDRQLKKMDFRLDCCGESFIIDGERDEELIEIAKDYNSLLDKDCNFKEYAKKKGMAFFEDLMNIEKRIITRDDLED